MGQTEEQAAAKALKEKDAKIADLEKALAAANARAAEAEAAHAELLATPAAVEKPKTAPTVWIVVSQEAFPNGLSSQNFVDGVGHDFRRAAHDTPAQFSEETVAKLVEMFGDAIVVVTPERAAEIDEARKVATAKKADAEREARLRERGVGRGPAR